MDIGYLRSTLAQHVLAAYIDFEELGEIYDIVIVTRQFIESPHPLSPHSLYLCHAGKLPLFLSCRKEEAITVITSGYSQALDAFAQTPGLNLIAVSMELFNLYNELNRSLFTYQRSLYAIKDAIFDGCGLAEILAAAADMFRGPVFLLDSSYRLVAEDIRYDLKEREPRPFIRALLQELHASGALSFQTAVQEEQTASGLFTANHVMVHGIQTHGITVARLFILLPPEEPPNSLYSGWGREVAGYLAKYLSSKQLVPNYYTLMDGFVADLIEQEPKSEARIREQARRMEIILPAYYSCLVIRQPGHAFPDHSVSYLLSQLSGIFAGAMVAYYQDHFVVILPQRRRDADFPLQSGPFLSLLEQFDACAGISYSSRLFSAFSAIHNESLIAIRLGSALSGDLAERVFRFSDYHPYLLVELAAQAAQTGHSRQSMAHLCSPAFLSLLRHDRKTGEDLTGILYTYLCNNRNTTRTAQALFMHRNTLFSKIEKIEDILGSGLDDPDFQFVLRLSYLITQYVERVLHKSIFDLTPPNSPPI